MPPRRDVTDTIPCGARSRSRGRSFVNYFADRVIRCGEEPRKGDSGDQWEAEGETYGVGVHMMSAMLERHSGISAAPTAGFRGATSRELPLARPTFYTAQHHAALRDAPRHDAHVRRYRRPQFLFDSHGGSGSSPEKEPRSIKTISNNTADYCDLALREENFIKITENSSRVRA